jgi:hypothetical protein
MVEVQRPDEREDPYKWGAVHHFTEDDRSG